MQRWGVFSVIDHKDKRAVAADVLLYDKLVVPTPINRAYPPTVISCADDKWDARDLKRWRDNDWDPDGLFSLASQLKLKGRVSEANWDPDRRKQWSKLYHELRASIEPVNETREEEFKTLGYWVTRNIIVQHIKDENQIYSDGVVEPYAAYQSEADFLALQPKLSIETKISELNCLIACRLCVPDDQNEDDALKRALDFADKDSFQKRRQNFYAWQRDLISGGHSPKNVLRELEMLVADYNEDVSKHARKARSETILTGLALGGVALGTAAAVWPALLASLGISVAAGLKAVTLATAGNTAAIHIGRHLLGRRAPDAAQQVAAAGAMFHQIEDELGWKLRIGA